MYNRDGLRVRDYKILGTIFHVKMEVRSGNQMGDLTLVYLESFPLLKETSNRLVIFPFVFLVLTGTKS